MTFPIIVVQEGSKDLLGEIGVRLRDAGDGYYTADSVEASAKLIAAAVSAPPGCTTPSPSRTS
jgi:ribulose 1,5-bisphosphate synthetase/thiazole synthase